MDYLLPLFALLLVFFYSSAPPLRDLPSDNTSCNIKNGQIFIKNECQRLLLCYQSNWDDGTVRIGRHFGRRNQTNGKKNFTECAKEIGGKQWHGLIIGRDNDGRISFKSSLGFAGVFDSDQIKQMEKHTEIDLVKTFESFRNEFLNALSFGAFFGEYAEVFMAMDFVTSFCRQNGTINLCKAKCLSHSSDIETLASHGSTKSVGTLAPIGPKTSSSAIPTTTTDEIFPFVPYARHVDHFGTNCTNIFLPTEVSKIILNITASPYEIACQKYQLKINDPAAPNSQRHRFYNGCMNVPMDSEKCQNSEKLIGCYKSSRKWSGNSPTDELCQKHFNGILDANFAGFIVQICAHRKQNTIIVESTFNISFSNETFKRTQTFPISLEKIYHIRRWMPIYLIEFGNDQQKSAIREKAGTKNINGKWDKNVNEGIGTFLNDIAPQMVNGTLAKIIHFVPPSDDDKILAFFQTEKPKYSKFISRNTKLKKYENDPNKFNRPTMCDEYGDDCEPIRNLLLKIEALDNCGKPVNPDDQLAFKVPDWAPMPPSRPMVKPSISLLCDGDLVCDKERLKERYNRLRKICGLEPEKEGENNSRQKRQYRPIDLTTGKWTKFPIKIGFNKLKLPEEYHAWEDSMKIGADLIINVTCVRFEFVDEMDEENEGISIVEGVGSCGTSFSGRIGGWQ